MTTVIELALIIAPFLMIPFVLKYQWKGILVAFVFTLFVNILYSWAAIPMFVFDILLLVFLVVIGIIKIFKKNLHKNWYQIPLAMIGITLTSFTITEVITPLEEPLPEKTLSPSAQISYLKKTDQGDRKRLRTYIKDVVILNNDLMKRDSLRELRTNEIVAEHSNVLTLKDKLNAAMIYQHSYNLDSATYRKAYELSKAAYDGGLQEAKWLSEASYDRWQQSIGNEQKYSTQYQFGKKPSVAKKDSVK